MSDSHIAAKPLVGYLHPVNAKPGDRVEVKVSSELEGRFDASLVRLISGDSRPHGTGYRETVLDATFAGQYPARRQPVVPGSFGGARGASGAR